MKTEGLTIQEAVKRLKEGRCDGVRPANNASYMVLDTGASNISPTLTWVSLAEWDGFEFMVHHKYILPIKYILEPCWSLVHPKPKMEEVEVSRWINIYKNGKIGSNLYNSKMDAIDCSKYWAEPATQKEIKIKVEREVEAE